MILNLQGINLRWLCTNIGTMCPTVSSLNSFRLVKPRRDVNMDINHNCNKEKVHHNHNHSNAETLMIHFISVFLITFSAYYIECNKLSCPYLLLGSVLHTVTKAIAFYHIESNLLQLYYPGVFQNNLQKTHVLFLTIPLNNSHLYSLSLVVEVLSGYIKSILC